ncbi:MAG: YhgE/Pip domain-containing protein [Actinomycetaceae bacterium]|nr:YhgE/Pip domain-containing protein [Actinomycetaceae bacterium]
MKLTLRDWRALVTVMLLPLLATALTLWSLANRAENFDQVPAALVNLDKGATMEVDGKEQFVPLGRELASGLMYPTEEVDTNLNWQLVTEDTAKNGLLNGDFQAIVTIPEKFSENLTTIGQKTATPALITVTSNDASSELVGVISKQIARVAATSMGSVMTEKMLDQIYLGFNEMADQLAQAADGAAQLDDGARQLGDGLSQLAYASDLLAGGTRDLSTGLGQLSGGAHDLSSGTYQLTDGLTQLASGANQLTLGIRQFRDGFVGTAQSPGLKDGIDQVNHAINDPHGLADGSNQLADGAAQLKDGIDQLTLGLQQITGPLAEFEKLIPPDFGKDIPRASEVEAVVERLRAALENSENLLAYVKEQLHGSADTVGIIPRLRQSVSECPVEERPEYCRQLELAVDDLETVVSTIPSSNQDVDAVLADFNGLMESLGVNEIVDEIISLQKKLEGYIQQLEDAGGFTGIDANLTRLRQGTAELSDGTRQLANGIAGTPDAPGLAQGVAQLAEATELLRQGLDGTSNQAGLVSGAEQLAGGLDSAVPGVRQLADGAYQLAQGAEQSASGSRQLADGSAQLASGVGQASDGASELIAGTTRFANELKNGAEQVPTYTDAERTRIVKMAAVPIHSGSSTLNEARSGANVMFPWAAGFVLWIGAFATYLAMPGLRRKELASAHKPVRVAWNSFRWAALISIAQTIGVALVATMLGVRPQDLMTTTLLLGIGALSFTAVNQAMLAVAGARLGRIVALLFLVVQMVSLGGIVPIETAPEAFRALNAVLPLSVLTNGLTHTVMGGQLTTFFASVAPLVVWGAGAFGLTTMAANKARQVDPGTLRRKYA